MLPAGGDFGYSTTDGNFVNARGDVVYSIVWAFDRKDIYLNGEVITDWLGPRRGCYSFGLNDAGQVAYGASTGPGYTYYVDRTDRSTGVLDPNKTYDYTGGHLDENGVPP